MVVSIVVMVSSSAWSFWRAFLRADAFETVGDVGEGDVVRQAAFQAEQEGIECAVSASCQRQRAVNVDDDALGLRVQPRLFEVV